MEKLRITNFNRKQLRLSGGITCSVEQVIKLGLLGYLDSISELRLRQYLILRETKVLGGLVDYELNDYRLRYQGQTVDVKLQIPVGVVDLDWCFMKSDIETLQLRGKTTVSLYGLVESCKLLREVLIDIDYSDEVIDLRSCFRSAIRLQRVTFSKAASRAKTSCMFCESGIKEIRLSGYVINVEDNARGCFDGCKELVDLDCSGVKLNKDVLKIVGKNPKLETISFRDCWFGGKVKLTRGSFLRPVTIDLRGARCKGIEGVTSLKVERKSNKAVDAFIKQFELDKVMLILD